MKVESWRKTMIDVLNTECSGEYFTREYLRRYGGPTNQKEPGRGGNGENEKVNPVSLADMIYRDEGGREYFNMKGA